MRCVRVRLVTALAWVLLTLPAMPSRADMYVPEVEPHVQRMHALNLIRGRFENDLALPAPITRAEFVVLMVRAFGREAEADAETHPAAFRDTGDHWANGYISVAVTLLRDRSETAGMPDGSFRPDAPLSAAEAVAFLSKFIGVKCEQGLSWPQNYFSTAAKSGLISADDQSNLATTLNEPITRGAAIKLADATFYSYPLPNGRTVYTTYVDITAPTLTVDWTPPEIQATSMEVSGTVSPDVVRVYIGTHDNLAALNGTHFVGRVSLEPDRPFSIVISAVDIAGNQTEKRISRTSGGH